jgi:hypothetical protein
MRCQAHAGAGALTLAHFVGTQGAEVSWLVTARVQRTRVGSPSAKALLLALANFSDDNGQNCFPGQEALADITELSLDTIQR